MATEEQPSKLETTTTVTEEEEKKEDTQIKKPLKYADLKSLFASVDKDVNEQQKLKKEQETRDKLQREYDRLSKAISSIEAATAVIEFMSKTDVIKKDPLFTPFNEQHPFMTGNQSGCIVM
eukprot:874693_1